MENQSSGVKFNAENIQDFVAEKGLRLNLSTRDGGETEIKVLQIAGETRSSYIDYFNNLIEEIKKTFNGVTIKHEDPASMQTKIMIEKPSQD